MPELDCTVESCLYNKRSCCCLDSIKVTGHDALDKEDTCCSSFEEKRGDSFTSATEHPNRTVDVQCDATDCTFNEDCLCEARHIGVAGGHASSKRQTECASFTCECS